MFLQRIGSLNLWKKIYLYIYTLVVVVLLAGCCFMCFKSRNTYAYQGEYTFSPEDAGQEVAVYKGISLSPGVYRIGLQYQTDRDYAGLCSARDAETYSADRKALLTNGEHLYAGLGSTGYQLWLFEATNQLEITVSYGGEGNLYAGDLIIANTGQLWTMIAVLILVLACMGYAAMILWAYYKRYGISKQSLLVVFFLMAITLVSSWAQLRNSVLGGADLTYHLLRIEAVKDGLMSGQFPVRIAPEWLYGHGYADPVLYCNAFLWFPAALRIAGFTVTMSYNMFCIMLNLLTAVIAWYCFGRIFKDYRIGLLCSGLYTLSFMRIYKLAIVGAVGEGSAMTFLPLILYGLYRIFTEDTKAAKYKSSWIPVTLGYAGIIQCHVLTCEITAFVTILICLVCIRRVFSKPVFMALLKGASGAVALSLWYLVPFLDYYLTQDMHIRHVSGRTIQERGLYMGQLLVNSWSDAIENGLVEKGLTEVETGGVGVILVMALFVFAGTLIKRADEDKSVKKTALLSAAMSLLLLFMSLRIFPWDHIQASSAIMASLVSSLQFPNRFLGWATVFLCVVLGWCVYRFREKRGTYLVATVLVIASIVTGSHSMVVHALAESDSYSIHNEEGMGCGYISGAEYLVEGTDDLLLTFSGPVGAEGVLVDGYVKEGLRATMDCVNGNAEIAYADLPILLYKGYHAYDLNGAELEIGHGFNHLLRVYLPAGYEGRVTVDFQSPWYWRISELITGIMLVFLVVQIIRYGASGRKGEES